MPEKYIPTSADIARAEEMMTPEQRDMSEVRERFKFQERDLFEDFLQHIDAQDERRAATAGEVEKMDASLAQLSGLFAGSGLRWTLDGAINISAYSGAYIGVHKDIDIAVEAAELEQLDGLLERKGYGLFLSYETDELDERGEKKRMAERVDATRARGTAHGHLMIAAITTEGEIRKDTPLNFIDMHVVARDAGGEPIGPVQMPLPAQWFEPVPSMFRGVEINLSHPAKVAYYKLHQKRVYDMTDLRKLVGTGRLSEHDVAQIQEAVEEENALRRLSGDALLRTAALDIEEGMGAQEIEQVFLRISAIKDAVAVDPRRGEQLQELAVELSKLHPFTFEGMRDTAMRVFHITEEVELLEQKTQQLVEWAASID